MKHTETPYPPITAGDCAVIYGADAQKSAYTLWAEKRGLVPSRSRSPWQELSRKLEPVMLRRFRERTGLQPRHRTAGTPSHRFPWAVAQGHWVVEEENTGLTMKALEAPPVKGGMGNPLAETYECLHQMMVLEKTHWYLALYIPGREFVVHRVTATENTLRALAMGEEQFWQRVVQGEAPVLDGSDSTMETLEQLYPQPREEDRDLTPAEPYIRDYLHWKALEEEAGTAARIRANTIKSFLGPCARGHLGPVQVLWPLVPARELDLQALKREHPELDLERYRPMERRFQVLGTLPET